MCGISAIVSLTDEPPDGALERMTERLIHRGPDARGCQRLPGCHLGHTRLSIIDLNTGAQPMQDASGRYWITFNGEIYNYHELRRELWRKGFEFNSHSDTEVIMAAYAAWGKDCLERLRGMFAFALWDSHERLLFAARDLFGEKPLHYATAPDGSLLIASEIKSLLATGLLTPRLDLSMVDAYLAFGYVPPDRTVYQNVHTLPPAHYLTWKDRALRVVCYWAPQLAVAEISLEEAVQRLDELVQRAVQRQMVADVPVGAFLSGGLDSSTTVALMQQQSSSPVKTFSVGFGRLINELPYARAVARMYDTEHYEVNLRELPVADLLIKMADVYDEPFADSSCVPTYLIAEFARRQVKVVLSGDGGDELFGGYAWYLPLARSETLSPSLATWLALRVLSRMTRDRIPWLTQLSVAAGWAYRWPDMWTRCVKARIAFRAAQRRCLWGERGVAPYSPGDYYVPPAAVTGLNRGFYFDLTSYLPGDILVKVDRAAMAHGLETRTPFLDRDLVEFILSLPPRLKVTGGQSKMLFRYACRKYWPREVQARGKQGFGAPYPAWLARRDVKALVDAVSAHGAPLRRLLPGVRPSDLRHRTYQAWVLLVLGLWAERHQVVV